VSAARKRAGRRRLELRDARRSADDRAWLASVYPMYLHDLSAFDDGYYQLDERGVWHPDYLPSWLAEGPDLPFVVVAEGRRVGFALVNSAPSRHVARGRDHRVSEFFVLARERRTGIGTRAAHALFALLPGAWEVSQLPRNERAIRFWRRVAAEVSDGDYRETAAADEIRQTFRTRARRAGR